MLTQQNLQGIQQTHEEMYEAADPEGPWLHYQVVWHTEEWLELAHCG
jgi:hypothetical protein